MPVFDGDLRFWIQTAVILALVVATWVWGGGPERCLAGVLVWFLAGDQALHLVHAASAGAVDLEIGHIAIDLVGAIGATAVALFANRAYSLWFAAFQLIALLAHLAHYAAPGVATLAHRLLWTGPSYFQIVLLAGGIWFHRRRVARFGPYRSWRSSWLRSPARRPNSSPNG